MKRVHGRDLLEVLQAQAEGDVRALEEYPRAKLLRIFQDVCHGVAYAHSRGVLHRDLKPANVMLGDYGEVLILDWGLAKAIGEEEGPRGAAAALPSPLPELTMVGQVFGTPSYMPPEQAAGRVETMNERSDVYGLGTILYSILTRRVPFEGKSAPEILGKVKAGRFTAPAKRATEAGVEEPVPRGLEAICQKAMALRPQDRFASASELAAAVQAFVEGSAEQSRLSAEAREHLDRGRAEQARADAVDAKIMGLEARIADLRGQLRPHQKVEEKRPLWEAEAEVGGLREKRLEHRARAEAEFREALRLDPECDEAAADISDLLMERYLDAERRSDRVQMAAAWNAFDTVDRRGERRYRLDAPGKLELRAFIYACPCLRPVKEAGWGIEVVDAAAVAWRDGAPRPDLAAGPGDLPVPAVWLRGSTKKHGHVPACRKFEKEGVEVWVARFKEVDRRLVPVQEMKLGKTPIQPVELPQGDYVCFLRAHGLPEVRVPVRITREGHWKQDVVLYAPSEIPDGFLLVPGGPFQRGRPGEEDGLALPTGETKDVFVARFPVTCGEYLEFLNDLCARGQLAEAERRRPKEAERRFWVREGEGGEAHFRLPTAEEDPELAWEASWPVLAVTWNDAVAYCEWRSARDGRAYRLLHEDEHEKAARGVDGRGYSFGRAYEGAYAHTSVSLAGAARPLPVGSADADESVYGVRDLSGGAATWCFNLYDPALSKVRAVRGGSWGAPPAQAHAAARQGLHPASASLLVGFRLACAATAWP
jgi:serine/threonine-protein kinase